MLTPPSSSPSPARWGPPPGTPILSIGELTRCIKGLVEEGYQQVWVQGEISNLARPSSGNLYLTLKDDEAPLKAVLYRGIALRLRYDLRDGMGVIARGRLTVFMPRGEYQLLIEEIHPKGIGPLELAFRQLKEKLSVQGYFMPQGKKKLPRIPRRIGLLTSATGSAVRDLLQILARRWPVAEVWVCPVRVQGEGAAACMAETIQTLNALQAREACLDVLILARGGGTLEDLWPFNEEVLAQAIFDSHIPIVTGIGHEDDLTIADMVADVRALTPSEAATKVVPDRQAVLAWLEELSSRCRALLLGHVQIARQRIDHLAGRPCLRRPLERIHLASRSLDTWEERLARAIRQRLLFAQKQLESHVTHLEGLSPLGVLARGYSLTRRAEDLAVIRSPDQVQPGDRLITNVQQGQIVSTVEPSEPGTQRSGVSGLR